jgi:hypothetical protein
MENTMGYVSLNSGDWKIGSWGENVLQKESPSAAFGLSLANEKEEKSCQLQVRRAGFVLFPLS